MVKTDFLLYFSEYLLTDHHIQNNKNLKKNSQRMDWIQYQHFFLTQYFILCNLTCNSDCLSIYHPMLFYEGRKIYG